MCYLFSEEEGRVRAWDSMAVESGSSNFFGKLQNLLIAGELPECKLLVDTVSMSIEDLESISVWIRDAKKLKVRSDIIESSLSELPSCLNREH